MIVGGPEILIVLTIWLVFFGVGKIPEMMRGLADALRSRGQNWNAHESIVLSERPRLFVDRDCCLVVTNDRTMSNTISGVTRGIFRRVIVKEDYTAMKASLAISAPAVSIVDLDLKGNEGPYALAYLRNLVRDRNHPTARTAVICIGSGEARPPAVTSRTRDSFEVYLPKSVLEQNLAAIISKGLHAHDESKNLPRSIRHIPVIAESLPRFARYSDNDASLPRVPDESNIEHDI